MTMLAAILIAIKEHWPKIVIAVLVAFVVAAVATCERENIRTEERLVETGKRDGQQQVTIEQQERTIRDVEAYKEATERPDAGELGRVRASNDRCTRNPAACE